MSNRKRPRKNKAPKTPGSHPSYEKIADELVNEFGPGKQIHVNNQLSRKDRKALEEHLSLRTTPVVWGVPCDELMYTTFFTNFVRMRFMPWDSFLSTESTYLPSARNQIHGAFKNDMDAPFLMMLDSDVVPPLNLVEELLKHDKHLVGGWYRNKNMRTCPEPHPIVYDFVSESEDGLNFRHREIPGKGLERVDGMGAGCWLMSRELAIALGDSPYSMEKATEDFVLSKKVMDLGYEMFVDWDMACAHVGVGFV